MMVRFSGLVTAGVGKFEESRAQAVTAKDIGFVGEFPTHTSTQKRNGCAKKAYLGTGDRTALTSTGPLHPSDFALRLKAPQQSAHLRRVEQYCSARQVLPLLLPRPDLLISLVVIHLLLVRPFLSSSSFLPLVVAFDITVSEL